MYQLKKCNLCKGKSLFTLYSQSISHNKPWSDFIEKRNFPLLIEGKLCRSCGWIFKDSVFNSDELNQLYNFEDERVSLEAELLADKTSKYRGEEYSKQLPRGWHLQAPSLMLEEEMVSSCKHF
tara:strand:- start:65 stop:433 length:369 start_codon:yes stop_codon:yes gene_type:complete